MLLTDQSLLEVDLIISRIVLLILFQILPKFFLVSYNFLDFREV